MTNETAPPCGAQPNATTGNDTAKKFGIAGWISLITTIVIMVAILLSFIWGPVHFAGIKLYEADQAQQVQPKNNAP